MDICQSINDLAYMSGIELHATIDEKVGLLKAMNILSEDFDYRTQDGYKYWENFKLVEGLIEKKKNDKFINIVRTVPILRENKVETVEISLPDGVKKLKWDFYEDEDPRKYYKGEIALEESDRFYSGEVSVDELEKIEFSGDEVTRTINGTTYRKYRFKFPFKVRMGYHSVEFSYVNKDGRETAQRTRLIAAPEKCYDRLGIKEGKKTWGVPVQLYEQVSENNIGIGNYSDLAQLGYILGKNGAGILGVNPVHANRGDQPENASPYSPDSRMFFNYIYLDVTAVEEFKRSKAIQDYYNYNPEFQHKLERNRRCAYVDYTTTQEIVDDIMHKCFEEFKKRENKEDYNRYKVYCDSQDGILEMYATFRALNDYFSKQKPMPLNWTYWPQAYKNPKSPEFLRFVEEHKDEIEFYKYTQWQCNKQLATVKDSCLNSGMKIGLYMDMAVGASPKGFEAWYYSDLFIKGSAGAMPDDLSPAGQVWNVLGFNPSRLQEEGYEPYRKILEANMKYAGCIRIDHVLQLNRLYFHLDNGEKGNYVYYNTEELLAIVALESHRNKTMIIGEDIGNTTDQFRRQMEDYGILSYKVLPFERENDCYRSMRRPEHYPELSVCATSTHDTPTLVNQWNVKDIWQKAALGFYNKETIDGMLEQYASQREALNWMLEHYGCWKEVGGKMSSEPRREANNVPAKYEQAVAAWLGRSKSAIMLMPFTDILGVSEVGNIPGTLDIDVTHSGRRSLMEVSGNNGRFYPNWRKKLHIPLEHIEEVETFQDIAEILNHYRGDGNDGRGRYYQFERLGYNKESSVDFERAKRLYNILRYREEYRLSETIRRRYGEKFVTRWNKRRDDVLLRHEEFLKDWEEHQEKPSNDDGVMQEYIKEMFNKDR